MPEGLDRSAKIAALDAYLAELDGELGPVSDTERVEASDWADRVLGRETCARIRRPGYP